VSNGIKPSLIINSTAHFSINIDVTHKTQDRQTICDTNTKLSTV